MAIAKFTSDNEPAPVWVVFTGQTDLWILKWLKAGFRHCFLVMQAGGRWLSYDPLSHCTEIKFYSDLQASFDLPGWLEDKGCIVVRARPCKAPQKPAPLMIFTCVEAIKRALGIHNARILTPWQLYKFINKNNTTKGDFQWVA